MDKRDIYLWGALLALVREQLETLEKLSQGSLGLWGRLRIKPRNREIQKFLVELMQRRSAEPGEAAAALQSELMTIAKDTDNWRDIKPQELDYVGNILSSLATR